MELKIKKNNIFLFLLFVIFFFMTSLFCILEFSMLERAVLPVLICFLIAVGVFIFLNIKCKDKFISKIFLMSILIHCIFILLWQLIKYYVLGLSMPTTLTFVPFISDNDAGAYHQLGVYINNYLNQATLSQKYYGGLFPKLVGIIYHYTAINPIIVCLLNAFVATIAAIYFYLIGKNVIHNYDYLKIYTLLCICCTSYIVNTSVMIRDAYIVLFMYATIYYVVCFLRNKNFFCLINFIISIYCLYCFRPYAAIILFFAIFLALIVANIKIKYSKKYLKMNKITLILILCFPFILAVLSCLVFIAAYVMNNLSLDNLLELRETGYTGSNSDYPWTFIGLYNIFPLLPFIVGYLCLFLAPFPYEWVFVKRLHFVPDMIILYFVLPSFFKNIKKIFQEQNLILLIYFFAILIMFFLYSITVANSGTIHRLRGSFIPMIYLIAMYHPKPLLRKILNTVRKWRLI